MTQIPEGFTAWEGGVNPVNPPSAIVEYVARNGGHARCHASLLSWTHRTEDFGADIIAYRVVSK